MKLRFTHHAQSQAFSRNINESQIADTIRNPDMSGPAAAGVMFYRKKFGNGTMEVICRRIRKNKHLVLTAYFL